MKERNKDKLKKESEEKRRKKLKKQNHKEERATFFTATRTSSLKIERIREHKLTFSQMYCFSAFRAIFRK
jgi:hypothetical protein